MADYAFMMRGSSEESRLYLRQTAKQEGISMGQMFDRLVQLHKEEKIWERKRKKKLGL